ncbi:NfeD family protein [Lysinibacillus antri]|uniref:Nodulation protein NfeD n=1 Tax=Lysinibacillus antri TaxID=2498145 RepID=A0A3S0WIT9_9BACI|nr:nodulation protein NfeD [Lysinibacillus antri]RUL57049.1 nodulation protein NfeD [Lysinibacillus antri]
MKKTSSISWILICLLSFTFIFPSLTAHANKNVYHIPLEDEVEKGLYAFLQRAFEEAVTADAKAIILEIHTPGGFTDAAEDIAKLMDNTPVEIIAFINSKAHSAGAFLALHADKIYMVPDGTMGAAAIIDSAGNAADEKANSAWITTMKVAAESSKRKPIYAQAMADKTVNLPELRAPEGKLLTLSASEALEVGYSEGTVKTLSDVLARIGLEDSEVISIEPTFAEKIARFITNPIVVTLLLTVASLGLMIELFSPGFGWPGLTALTAFAAFFFGHMVAGLAGYESVLIFVVGLILLVSELFVPGGIVGIIGGAFMIISLLFAGESVVHMAYSILIALFIAVMGMVVLMKFFGKNLHVFNKLILRDATTTEEGYVSNVNRIELLGKIGETITPLRPAGTVVVGNERIDVVSEGSYIDSKKKVEIIQVEGSRIVVREMKEGVEKI